MADTDITLSVDLNVADAEKTAEQLHKEVQKIFESREDEQSASLTQLELQMKQTTTKAEELKKALTDLGQQQIPTESYKELEGSLDKTIIQYDKLTEKATKMRAVEEEFDAIKGKISDTELLLTQTTKQLDALYDKSDALAAAGKSTDGVEADIKSLHRTQEDLRSQLSEYKAELKDTKFEAFTQLQKDIEKTDEELDVIRTKMAEMREQGTAYQAGTETEEYQKLQAELDKVNDKLKQQVIHHNEIIQAQQEEVGKEAEKAARTEATMGTRGVTSLTGSVRTLSRLIPGISGSTRRTITASLTGVRLLSRMTKEQLIAGVQALKGTIAKLFAFISSNPIVAVIGAVAAALGVLIKKVYESYKAVKDFVENAIEWFKQSLPKAIDITKNALVGLINLFINAGMAIPRLFATGIGKLYSGLMSLKGTIVENLKLMAQWRDGNNDVNTALSNLTSSCDYLRSTLATAVAPILIAIEPIITRITDAIAQLVTWIGMLIAKLTGANYFQKAVKQQKNFAKSLKQTGQSAEEATGALAGFDKLNVINSNKNSGGAGDDGGIGGFAGISLKKIPIDSWLKDFYKLGRKLGTILKKALDSINWKKIQSGAKKAATAVADFINGFMSVKGLGKTIGKTFGEIINTITGFINTFLDVLNGEQLGKQIGSLFTSLLKTTDFKEVGRVFSKGINELSDIVIGFTKKFDGSAIGRAFSDFLSTALGELDWRKINKALSGIITDITQILNGIITPENFGLVADTLANTMTTVFDSIWEFASGVDWTKWGESIATAINNFVENTDWILGAKAIGKLADGLFDTLLEAVNNINWATPPDSIADKLIEFLSNIPWEDLGKKAVEISEKLRQGLQDIWDRLEESGALDDMIQVIVDFLNEKKTWENMLNKIKKQMIREIFIEKWKSFFEDLGESLGDFFVNSFLGEILDMNLPSWMTHGATGNGGGHGFATGGIIPPTAQEHYIKVGDNNVETEIVSPLSTIEQAVRNVIGENNVNVTFEVQGDPNRIFNVVRKESQTFNKSHGYSAFA